MDQRKFLDILDACENFPHYEILRKERFLKITLYLEFQPYPKKRKGLAHHSRIFNLFVVSPQQVVDWISSRIYFLKSKTRFHIPECRDIAIKFFKEYCT